MVSWVGDGLVSGYDPTTKKHKADLLHLASPGSVDVEGKTRLQWDLGSTYPNRDDYPTKLQIKTHVRFTTEDFLTYPHRSTSVTAVIAKASNFADGAVPTPSEIFNSPLTAWAWGVRFPPSKGALWTDTTLESDLHFLNAWMDPNTKYWLLVYPTTIADPTAPWSRANYRPWGTPGEIDTLGRAISFWTNQTPDAPVITSPPSGTVVAAGTTFDLKFAANDPDAVTPDDALRSNEDLAGVAVEYAALPTVDNPDPAWYALEYRNSDGEFSSAHATVGHQGSEKNLPILRNLSLPIICGVGEDQLLPSHGVLPAGDWQLRVKVADFGHAWPNIVNPLGATTGWGINIFPSENVSPWSEPIRVSIPTQVPPPIPLSPKDSVATQEGDTVRLSWQYRNTFDPPLAQIERWVQIRKVGDPDWSTVFAGASSSPFVDLPPSVIASATVPDAEYVTDGGFEGGSTAGWVASDGINPLPSSNAAGMSLSVITDAALSHSGTKHLRLDNTGASSQTPYVLYSAPITEPGHNEFHADVWVRPPNEAYDASGELGDLVGLNAFLLFSDVAGNLIEPVGSETTYSFTFIKPPVEGWNWTHVVLPPVSVPPGAVTVTLAAAISGVDSEGFLVTLTGHRVDDASITGTDAFNTDDFSLVETTQYEWRVRVRDAGSVQSDWSQPARFWVVPAAASGEMRPIPETTTDGATLGCGTHRVFVYRRGGLERVGELRGLSYVNWGRVRDDISTTKVIVKDWDIDCGNLLARLQTWAYELVVFRDNGYDNDRVWEGPISLLTYKEDQVEIHAKDVVAYPYRRIIKQRMSDTGTGRTVTARAAQILQNVMAPDDPNVLAYLRILSGENDAMQYRSTPAYSRTAYEEIDDMAANSGLDYTAVGRAILLWGTRNRIGTLPEFRDEDLGASPIVSEYGMSMSNNYAVSDGNGVYGEADRLNEDGIDPIYGLVEMLSSTWATDSTEDTGTFTQEGLDTVRKSFKEFAERSIADRYPPPVVVRVPDNTTVNPDAVLSIQQLVPGVVIPLRSSGTLRSVVGDQKLDSVNVVEEKGKETITITLSPFNYDDAGVGVGAEGEG